MDRMIQFALVMAFPDNTVPAIGDTWLYWGGWTVPINKILENFSNKGFCSEETRIMVEYFNTNNVSELAPQPYSYKESGYLLIKKIAGESSWAIFVKAGPKIHSH